MERVVVVGTSGSGKTTLAADLARRLDCRHVELDALHWGPDWTPEPVEVFRRRVEEAVAGQRWVIDGNYSAVRPLIWARATDVVWLNYSFPLVVYRVLSRTLRRVLHREELWHGNRESLRKALFARDSILLWVLQTYHRRRREMPRHLARPEHAHLRLTELRRPREARLFLDSAAPS